MACLSVDTKCGGSAFGDVDMCSRIMLDDAFSQFSTPGKLLKRKGEMVIKPEVESYNSNICRGQFLWAGVSVVSVLIDTRYR
jgi:hypothetical protein